MLILRALPLTRLLGLFGSQGIELELQAGFAASDVVLVQNLFFGGGIQCLDGFFDLLDGGGGVTGFDRFATVFEGGFGRGADNRVFGEFDLVAADAFDVGVRVGHKMIHTLNF